jgi:hypothetical protein
MRPLTPQTSRPDRNRFAAALSLHQHPKPTRSRPKRDHAITSIARVSSFRVGAPADAVSGFYLPGVRVGTDGRAPRIQHPR